MIAAVFTNLSVDKLRTGTGREFELVNRDDCAYRIVIGNAAIYVFDTRYDNRVLKFEVLVTNARRDYEEVKTMYEETDIGTFKFTDLTQFGEFIDIAFCMYDLKKKLSAAYVKKMWRRTIENLESTISSEMEISDDDEE